MDAVAKQHERNLRAGLFGADPATEVLAGRLLRTREVALLFQVSERAVTDWARKGRLPSVRTPGDIGAIPLIWCSNSLCRPGAAHPTPPDQPELWTFGLGRLYLVPSYRGLDPSVSYSTRTDALRE